MGKDFRVSMSGLSGEREGGPDAGADAAPAGGWLPEGYDVQPLEERLGVFVDFAGDEELLERFEAEAAKFKHTPGEHARKLIGVYVQGLKRAGLG